MLTAMMRLFMQVVLPRSTRATNPLVFAACLLLVSSSASSTESNLVWSSVLSDRHQEGQKLEKTALHPQPAANPASKAAMARPRSGRASSTEGSSTLAAKGDVYTWRDGDKIRRVYLQEGLILQKSNPSAPQGDVIAKRGGFDILKKQSQPGADGQPVFFGQSGQLMTLPGGIFLVFYPAWNQERSDAFFARNGIDGDRVSKMDFIKNAFFVKTEAGLPSLRLANELAMEDGVKISSPNWWREAEKK